MLLNSLPTLAMLALLPSPSPLETKLSNLCGALMILLFLISSTLNPLVYYCFTRQKPTLTNYLFKLVAVLDFLANLPSAIVAGLALSAPRYGVFWPSTLGLISCVCGCVAQATTSLLAVTRSVCRRFCLINSINWGSLIHRSDSFVNIVTYFTALAYHSFTIR